MTPKGAFYAFPNISRTGWPAKKLAATLLEEAGVATIPVSSFYAEDAVTSVVRLCFSKKDSTLDAGIERLAQARRLFA